MVPRTTAAKLRSRCETQHLRLPCAQALPIGPLPVREELAESSPLAMLIRREFPACSVAAEGAALSFEFDTPQSPPDRFGALPARERRWSTPSKSFE